MANNVKILFRLFSFISFDKLFTFEKYRLKYAQKIKG